MRPRILIADDHGIVVEGVKRLLEPAFEIVGEVGDGRALVAEARRLRPDAIVADVSMPQMNGLEALARIRAEDPNAKLVILSMHANPAYARRALAAGAAAYVLKHAAPAELVPAIRAALRGGSFLSPALAGVASPEPATPARLTQRQRQIVELLSEGLSAKQIAERLAISPRTVEFHKYQVMRDHGLGSAAELVQFAIRNGIVQI